MPGAFPIWWFSGVPVIICPAELDIANADALAVALRDAMAVHDTVVVDLAGTSFCDCSALGVLAPARLRAAAAGGEIRLVIRAARVRWVFALTGLDQHFLIFSRVSAAVRRDLRLLRPADPAGDDGENGTGPAACQAG